MESHHIVNVGTPRMKGTAPPRPDFGERRGLATRFGASKVLGLPLTITLPSSRHKMRACFRSLGIMRCFTYCRLSVRDIHCLCLLPCSFGAQGITWRNRPDYSSVISSIPRSSVFSVFSTALAATSPSADDY